MPLVLRRANASRIGLWQHDDYDVFDGGTDVGRILQQAVGQWFWGRELQAYPPQELCVRAVAR
jgi:hypothetical protein